MRTEPNGWLTSNELRNYPFKENQTRQLFIGTSVVSDIPNNVILDLIITTPFSLTTLRSFRLNKIKKIPSSITFTFSNSDGTNIANIIVPISGFVERKPLKLNGLVPFTHGIIILGEGFTSFFNNLGLGTYSMTNTSGLLEERVVKNNPYSRVTSISNLEEPSIKLIGDVKLAEGYNFRLTKNTSTNSIKLDARVGAGKGIFCGEGCDEPEQCDNALYSINGIKPNREGNINIEGINFIKVTPGIHKIFVDSIVDETNICERTGDAGDTGPTGPDGPGGPGGASPTSCDPCESDLCGPDGFKEE